jgi:hypothetical protein
VIAHKPLEYLENEPNYYLESPTIFSLTVLEIGTSLDWPLLHFQDPKASDKAKITTLEGC